MWNSSLILSGSSSSQFANRMKKNRLTARGATNGWTLPRLFATRVLTWSTTASHTSWIFVGTWSEVSLVRVPLTSRPSSKTSVPATSVEMIVSMLNVRPPMVRVT